MLTCIFVKSAYLAIVFEEVGMETIAFVSVCKIKKSMTESYSLISIVSIKYIMHEQLLDFIESKMGINKLI